MSTRANENKAERLATLKAGQDCEQQSIGITTDTSTESSESSGSLFGSIKATWDKTFGGKAEVGAEGKVTVASSDVGSDNKQTKIECKDGVVESYREKLQDINDKYEKEYHHDAVLEEINQSPDGQYVKEYDGDEHTYSKTPEGCIKETIDKNWNPFDAEKIYCDKEIPPPGYSKNTPEDTEVLQALADAGLIEFKEDGSIESKEDTETTIKSDDPGIEIA